ncbi:MAG TPA: hypothetical protein VGJ26_05565 [Pirellulales bacterium]
MAKVIVERPRHGPRQKCRKGYFKQWRQLPPEDWPKRERIKEHKGGTKHFNEHLGPLRRYFRKQVGRPWNLVFAEVCVHLRQDSVVQSHVRDHIPDIVEIGAIEIDGVICHGVGYRLGRPLAPSHWMEFYVCPRTGLLRKIKLRRPAPAPAPPVDRLPIDAMREYRRIDGIWYELSLRPITSDSFGKRDLFLRIPVSYLTAWKAIQTYGARVYAARRRQLNSKEIKRLKGA